MAKRTIDKAKAAKKDEFYTQLEDINNELRHYREHFRGKTVLCNCDDPRVSNFFTYFAYNFEFLGLKKLITTCYKNQDMDLFSMNKSEQAVFLVYEGDKNGNHIPDAEEIGVKPLKGDGDFRSNECIELLKEADVVVTNPPFSLFREYVAQLMEYDKKFLIIGNKNALTYIITAKPKAHAFKNEMCFPLTKTKCELKKHPNSKFECFFNDFNRTKTSLFLPFPSKLIQDNLVCVLELQE